MADFSKLVITNKGRSLIAKVIANTAVIEFTKVSASSEVCEVEGLENLEELTAIHQTTMISSVSVTNNTSVEIQAAFTNMEVEEGYYLRVLGLYANDQDEGEILYGVTAETSGNCYIPAYNGVTSSGIYLQFVTTVGNAENVSLEINPAAIATIGDVENITERLKIIDFDDTGEVEGIGSFTDFLSSFVKGTSIYQLFANLKAGLRYVLHAGQLVNNGLCETSGEFPLDAAYGKTLTDQITGLYSDLQYKNISDQITHVSEIDIDAYVESRVVCISANIHSGTKGSITLIIDNKYAPRTIINGIYSSTSSEQDFYKFGGAYINNLGQINFWITDSLTYNEKVTFVYPLHS